MTLARQLKHFVAEPSTCAYLPDRDASLEYRLLIDVTEVELEHMLARGWRRFGPAYFRPACSGCRECVPLRIPVARFHRSRQQRRVWNKGQRFELHVGAPRVDSERLELYDRWHVDRAGARGWSDDLIDPEQYFHQFAYPHPAIREFTLRDSEADDRLVAVAIVDETPRALSAVYTFHDPDYRKFSLGTLSILRQIDRARTLDKDWLYLGYRVLGCPSSEYKARFRPHQLMTDWVGFDRVPAWVDPDDAEEPPSIPKGGGAGRPADDGDGPQTG